MPTTKNCSICGLQGWRVRHHHNSDLQRLQLFASMNRDEFFCRSCSMVHRISEVNLEPIKRVLVVSSSFADWDTTCHQKGDMSNLGCWSTIRSRNSNVENLVKLTISDLSQIAKPIYLVFLGGIYPSLDSRLSYHCVKAAFCSLVGFISLHSTQFPGSRIMFGRHPIPPAYRKNPSDETYLVRLNTLISKLNHCSGFTTTHNTNFVDQPCNESDGVVVHGRLVSRSSYKEKCPNMYKYLVPIKQYNFVLEVLRSFTTDVEHMTRNNTSSASSAITW